MDKTFFECVENRQGEKLLQGVLLFLLNKDQSFKKAFCDWVGWEPFIEAQEEYFDNGHRHDIVLLYNDYKKNIEIKLDAGWTTQQEYDPQSIDLVILPENRLGEAMLKFGKHKVKTWNEFIKNVLNLSENGKALLYDDLRRYERKKNCAEYSSSKLLGLILTDFTPHFFNILQAKINQEIPYLAVGNPSGTKDNCWRFYWGFYISNRSAIRPINDNHLWLGVLADVSAYTEKNELAYDLVLQVCNKKNAERLRPLQRLPRYYPFDWHDEGIILKKSSDGKFHADDVFEQCKDLLERYAELGRA